MQHLMSPSYEGVEMWKETDCSHLLMNVWIETHTLIRIVEVVTQVTFLRRCELKLIVSVALLAETSHLLTKM